MNATARPPFVGAIADMTARLICVAALIWFGLIVAENVARLFPGKASHPPMSLANQDLELPNLLATAPGHWSFAGTPISIQQSRCTQDQVQQQLDSLKTVQLEDHDSAPDVSRLVQLARSGQAQPSAHPFGQAWALNNEQVQLYLVASTEDPPRLIAGGFAVRDHQGWQLTIVKPQSDTLEHLLPLPADARRQCARIGDSGQLQLELVTVSNSMQALIRQWQSDGWKVKPAPWNRGNGVSYLCTRGAELVYTWSQQFDGRRTIMLSAPDTANDWRSNSHPEFPNVALRGREDN
jgi:hypothetical protein